MASSLPSAFWIERVSVWALSAGLLAALAATLFVATLSPLAALAIPVAFLALGVGLHLLNGETSSLATALVLSTGLAGYDDVSQIGEVLFVLYTGAYFTLWYGGRWASGAPILRSKLDVAVALFISAGLGAGVFIGIAAGADTTMLIGETRSFAMLLFYFPVREVCSSRENGASTAVWGLIAVGIFTTFFNAYTMFQAFSNADQLWQIIDVRTAYGETTLVASLLLSLALLLTSRTVFEKLFTGAIVSAVLIGFILTKSRGFWAAGAVGVLAMGLAMEGSERRRFVTTGATVLGSGALMALAVFGQYAYLLAVGLAKRFITLETATSADVSLINRFYESAAAWDWIVINPVLGYGFGVPFRRYDLIYGGTLDWAFIHNVLVGTWYKLGLWGLGLLCAIWGGSIWSSWFAARSVRLTSREKTLTAAATGVLVTLAIASNTSNPFMLADQTLVLAIVLGIANGLSLRAKPTPFSTLVNSATGTRS